MKTKIILSLTLIAAAITMIWAQSNETSKASLPNEIKKLELLAETGDTAALHKLIVFYDDNAPVYLEVEEVVEIEEVDGEWIAVADTAACDSVIPYIEPDIEALYTSRLEYWLEKGLAINDPVALATKGNRLYYEDEGKAIEYLGKAAEMGDGRAALFCGSACYNQGRGDEAFKYLTMAYNLGQPSAGWHLAMCYSFGVGTEPNREEAIAHLRHSAIMNYPEAVLEMKRIEPTNKIWQHKADSLQIDFSNLPIIAE